MSSTLVTTGTSDELGQHRIQSLPIVVLHVHSRCNCRCAMCDIWKAQQKRELSAEDLERMLPSFETLGVRWVVLTGGEPLLHSDIGVVCKPLRQRGIKVTLLTTGLLLNRYAGTAADLFDEIIISVDGPAAIHNQIRGIAGAFERIASGVGALRGKTSGMPLRARTTVQKANHRHLCETVRAVQELGLDSISFLAADLTSSAFNRELVWPVARQNEIGLSMEETSALEQEIENLISDYRTELEAGFIVESPAKLHRIVQHFRAHLGLDVECAPLCNAPWHSAVIELDGKIRPCFFHEVIGNLASETLETAINVPQALQFRAKLDIGHNPICKRCVCALNYRES